MTRTIRAHFDGSVIVPDEPVDLPVGEPLEVLIKQREDVPPSALDPVIRARLERLARATGTISGVPVISEEALRRENLYDERL